MTFRNTWILAGIAVAFGAYVYLGEFKKAAKEEEEKTANEKVLNIDSGKVKKVEIKNANGIFVVSKVDDKIWKLESPIQDLSDENMILGILSSLTSAKFDQSIEGEDLKGFGLDAPKSSVVLTLQDGTSKKVSVGSDAPLPGKIYLQRGDEKKILVGESVFKTQLDRALRDFRDKRIFRKNKDDIRSMVVKYDTKDNHGTVGLVRKTADWNLVGKKEEKADQEVVSGLISGIDGLRATEFPSEKGDQTAELKKYGLDKPEITLHLEDKDQKTLADILVSPKKDNNIYMKLKDSPIIYQGFGGAAEQLVHKEQDFRDKREPFDIKKEDIAEFMLNSPGGDIHLVLKNGNWELASPDPKKEVSQIQAANFLDKVASLRVSEFDTGEKPVGLNPPKGTMVIKNSKGQDLLTFNWGGEMKSKRSFFSKSSKVPYVFGTDTTAVNGLTGQPLITDKAPSPAASASPTKAGGTISETGVAGPSGRANKTTPEVIDVKPPPGTH